MSETPLAAASFDGAIALSEALPRAMITLRGDHTDRAFRDPVETVTRLSLPAQRRISGDGPTRLAWMSPDELLLMLPPADLARTLGDLRAALAGVHHLVADVSDARAVIALSGAGAREVLAKGAPVDMAQDRFGPAEIRRTRLGQVAVAFWMTGPETFELVCFRSVAGFVFDWLTVAAQPGSLPEHF